MTFNHGVEGSNPSTFIPRNFWIEEGELRSPISDIRAIWVPTSDVGDELLGVTTAHTPSDIFNIICNGLSSSGKTQHFDCCIRWFESN